MANTLGTALTLTTFGESHGVAIGGVIDGCPAGLAPDFDWMKRQLARRKTATGDYSSARVESDEVEFLSGLVNGKTIGTPVAFLVRNTGHKPQDYEEFRHAFRPSHADYAWFKKFGEPSGSGGGRTSARVLLPVVVAGAFAEAILRPGGISVLAWVSSIGDIVCDASPETITPAMVEKSPLHCPDNEASEKILRLLEDVKAAGDTVGGTIRCRISGVPAGLGEPVFSKLHADLAHAMMSINSVKGFEYGSGFEAAPIRGSEYNDALEIRQGRVHTRTNHDGGINGGISNGEDIHFRIALKPIPSVHRLQDTVDDQGRPLQLQLSGRHDTCAVPRCIPVVESLTALVMADHLLLQNLRKKS